MTDELKSGIPQFDNAVEQFENGEISFLQFASRLWNTAYEMGKKEKLKLLTLNEQPPYLCKFEQDEIYSSSTCKYCGGTKWMHDE